MPGVVRAGQQGLHRQVVTGADPDSVFASPALEPYRDLFEAVARGSGDARAFRGNRAGSVYSAGSASGYNCPGTWRPDRDEMPPRSATQVSGRGGSGSFGPLVQAVYQARHKAIDRMTTECTDLGGHGVVGVRLSRGSFPLGGPQFKAIGTAVRAPGAAHGPRGALHL